MKKFKYYYLICGIIGVLLLVMGIVFNYKSHNSGESALFIEKSSVDYSVCFEENDFYKDICQSENKEYLSSITNEIRVTFDYNRIYEKATKSNFDYYVGSRLSINYKNNNREIYEEEKVLTDEKNYRSDGTKEVDNIQSNVTIKYSDYNSVVDDYNQKYAISTGASLEVFLVIKEDKEERKVASISLPLEEQTFSVSKTVLEGNVEEKVDNTYKNYMFISLFLFVLDIIFIAVLVVRSLKNKDVDEFELEVRRLLTEYDRVIAETKGEQAIEGKQITEVNSFMELVDVRDTIEKPILYYRESDDKRTFIVIDENIVYRYQMINTNNKEG